jgi:hypothetical protein
VIRRSERTSRGKGACVALLTALAVSGCGGRAADEAEPPVRPVVPVRVERLEERSLRAVVTTQGQWRISDSLTVSTPFRAYVEALRPRAGDHVTQAELIGTLVTYESRAALNGAEILVRQAATPAERDEAERALRLAQRDLVRVPLVAASAGTVLRRSVEPGSEVAESAELLTLVPEGSIIFEAHVPRAEADQVALGARAQVAMEGGGIVETRVQRRLPQSNESDQSALFWLAPLTKEPFGVLGRFGSATVETGAEHRAVLVPDSALVEDDLTGVVRLARVVSGDVAVWIPVRLGAAEDGRHELLAPALPPGTLVLVRGQRGLPDSTRVRVSP